MKYNISYKDEDELNNKIKTICNNTIIEDKLNYNLL